MTLRRQIVGSLETVPDLEWAAEARFRDAEALLLGERFAGCVYLLGFACEMWLKLAAFRLMGAGPVARVAPMLGAARTWMAAHSPAIGHESYHSLQFWAQFVILRRAAQGRALPAEVAGALRHHVVRRLYEDWRVELRYRRVAVDERQAWRVYNDTSWLRAIRESLWR